MGTLYICPTPIGNLDDVSKRIADILNEVDLIYCEDTRRAKKLLNHLGINTEIESYFIGNEVNKIEAAFLRGGWGTKDELFLFLGESNIHI